MPVSVVCESSTAANVNAALRDSLANSSYGSSPGSGTNSHHDESLQNKLVASAKRVLLTKIEYEEVNNYNQSVLDTLKSKYIVLKPSLPTPQQFSSSSSSSGSASSGNGNCGKLIHTPATTTTSGSSSSSNHTSNKMNGNGNSDNKDSNNHHSSSSMANSGDKQQRNNTSELPQPKRILFPRESIQIGWKSSGRKWYVGSGMSNVGNTCYLNSTLQALFHVPSIANWLTSDTAHMERCEEELGIQGGCIICCMSKTLLSSQSQQSCIRPFLIYGKLKTICRHLTVGRQEDAHEFLRYLVEAMEKAYLMRFRHYKDLDQFSKETTPPNQILGGYLKSAVRCLACGYVSTTFQHFEDLLLDIRKADTIDEALEGYFSRERLEDMGYKCESCKKKVSATKQFSLERAPIALCIQLKRFSMLGTKINKQITIRPRLDLSRFASKKNGGGEQLTYKLVAMVTHLGASQNCGHYTAIGLTESGTYYSFDDSFVRPISVQSVVNTNAYIIFYELEGGQQNGHSGSNKNSGSSQTNNNEQSKENNQKNGNSNYNNSNGSNDNRQNFYGSSPNGPKLISKLNTEPKVIGPQLPEYYKTGNSNGFPGNGNKLVNTPSKLSNRPSSLPTSTGTTPNSSKIMIHFKNSSALNNGNSNATAVSSSSAPIASPATSSTDKLKILPSESEDEDEEKVTTTSNEVSSTTTLPHMPKLGMGSPVHPSKDKSASVSSTATAAVSATIKSPLKSLVPYESESDESSADDENDTKASPTCSSSSNTHTQNSKSPKKKKKKNEIDLLFKRKSNGVANSSPSPKKIKTASANDADTSTHHDFEDDSGDDSGNMKKSQSTPPSPPVIKTKTGLWQVTNLNPSTPISSNSKSNQQQTPTDKKYRNPFAAVRSTSPVNRQPAPTHKPTNFNSTAKSTNGGGGGERSEVVNELMKQSHRGYGAPVLSWNGNKTELEKEITEEARLQRKREWEEDDENEMDRGRQKKVKQPKAQVNATPGFNPFQEHQSQQNFHQRRWKLINNPSNHRYQNTSSNGGFRNGGGGGNNRKMNNFKRFGNKFHQRSSSHHQRSNGNYFHRRGS